MASKVVTKEDFENLSDEVVSDKYNDSSRWYENWTRVWKEDDKFYAYDYEEPATEMQEDSDDPFDPSRIYEVKPVQVVVTEYERV